MPNYGKSGTFPKSVTPHNSFTKQASQIKPGCAVAWEECVSNRNFIRSKVSGFTLETLFDFLWFQKAMHHHDDGVVVKDSPIDEGDIELVDVEPSVRSQRTRYYRNKRRPAQERPPVRK